MKQHDSDTRNTSLLIDTARESRRRFLSRSGALTLSGVAIATLGRHSKSLAGTGSDSAVEADIRILNSAIAAEYEAIAAYQLGADSGLLGNDTKALALQFQQHHKAHAEALMGAVKNLGGTPAEAQKQYDFPTEKLKQQADVLQFAAGLERGAVSAYVGAIPQFNNRDLTTAAASILADEAMHWAVLRHALGLDPVPAAFFS